MDDREFNEATENIAFELIKRYPVSSAAILAKYLREETPLKKIYDLDNEMFLHDDYSSWAEDIISYLKN